MSFETLFLESGAMPSTMTQITLTHVFLTVRLDNLDYDELKHLIKQNTSKDSGKSIAIPGHVDTSLLAFENEFLTELSNQHDRVELFVKSKSEEIGRRLRKSGFGIRVDRC